jgi:RimJ/RimL family protein N-acetyltransferase
MLTANAIQLRPPDPRDLPFFTGMRNDVALQLSLMALPRPNSTSKTAAWLASRTDDPQGVFFVIADCKTDTAVGFIQLTHMDLLHGTCELGICLAAPATGLGYAGEAMGLVEAYAQTVFNLRKIGLRVLVDNGRAVAFYDKIGYRRVGTLMQHHYQRGAYQDVLIMEKQLTAPRLE